MVMSVRADEPPDGDAGHDQRDQVVALAIRVLTDWLAATAAYPRLRLRADPSLPGRWRVAHCCQIIYVRANQDGVRLMQSIADALVTLRSKPPGDATCAPDELAARRHRRS